MNKEEVLALMKQCGFMLTDLPPEPFVDAMVKFAYYCYNKGYRKGNDDGWSDAMRKDYDN